LIIELDTYAEVSPTKTGVKLFAIGKLPFKGGRKRELSDVPRVCEKNPAIELYDHGRYFAVTGWRLTGPWEPQDRLEVIAQLCERYWPAAQTSSVDFHSADAAVERARKYLAKLPYAVSGSSGHNATFHAACVLVCGFQLDRGPALGLLTEWNQLCQPPWSDRELEHKINSALKVPGERGYLRNANPQTWDRIDVPAYTLPEQPKPRPVVTSAVAAQNYIDRIKAGQVSLVATGLPNLDFAIGGGLEPGEMVIVAARPSHGKSTVALQCAHQWTSDNRPVLFITEEMSAMALGKRTLQFASGLPQEEWRESLSDLQLDLHDFAAERQDCYIIENCGTSAAVVCEIERAVSERNIQAAIVDYAQLLTSPGKSRYEQITNTSIALRKAASEHKIILLVLCQLNREIEARPQFQPKLSDLKDTGQLEQDADVVIFLVWPHRIDPKQNPHNYKFYIAKNRNREIMRSVVECHFEPSRQMLSEQEASDMTNYEPAFENRADAWN
jgi:archaellum biogenesis ATPase FlaH